MSQTLPIVVSASTPSSVGGEVPTDALASASASEKNATSPAVPGKSPLPAAAPTLKRRSCVTCRSRKVRCDKLSPCSNCRRAKIDCIFPSGDRPPRWARRLVAQGQAKPPEEAGPAVTQVMERLRTLESLVKDLSGQLEQANATNAAAAATSGPSSQADSPASSSQDRDYGQRKESSPSASAVQQQFGRLVIKDASKSRYVSSGFWSRVNDEINELKMDTQDLAGVSGEDSDLSLDEEDMPEKSFSTQEMDRAPAERHAFLFRHNLGPVGPSLDDLRPLPSQIPFLLSIFHENVNQATQVVHMPTINKMMRGQRANRTRALTMANEALMFAIYYAAVTSMEDDDVVKNFGASKGDLNLQYRLGLELALAKADFLNVPDIVLVQAFTIFLLLARRHDSPRYVWMMTGLVIRMAQALGLQRDGTHFPNMTPYEVEIRRRVWWTLLSLDMRSSQDQGTELTISPSSYDTKMPLALNDDDLSPDTKETPKERSGITDMSFMLIAFQMNDIQRKMVSPDATGRMPTMEDNARMLDEIWQLLKESYPADANKDEEIMYWVGVNIARLVIAKMALLINVPVLFSSPSEDFSAELRTKLFISAIEVAEYNHALNAEPACQQWRWIYQTFTHWHAIVYMLIEIPRRSWSPTVERAWIALHSSWLIPQQSKTDKNLRVWIPLRMLMAKARKHRAKELERLLNDTGAARQVEAEDANTPRPMSSGPFPESGSIDLFLDRWRKLVGLVGGSTATTHFFTSSNATNVSSPGTGNPSTARQPNFTPPAAYGLTEQSFQTSFAPATDGAAGPLLDQNYNQGSFGLGTGPAMVDIVGHGGTAGVLDSTSSFPSVSADWLDPGSLGPGFTPWLLWADSDPAVDVFSNVNAEGVDVNIDMDIERDMDWHNWVESAEFMEKGWNEPPTNSGPPAWDS